MQPISNRYDDVEHFLFAELLAANANNGLNTERLPPADGPHNTNPDAATDNPKSLAGETSRHGWY